MEYMLFLMFFTSPPAAKAHPVWTLQSTSQFQFSSMAGCIKYGQHLQDMVDSTDTVAMRGWCVDQGSGGSTYGSDDPYAKKDVDAGKKEEDIANYVQIESKLKTSPQRKKRP
jgi:hypothetical protein